MINNEQTKQKLTDLMYELELDTIRSEAKKDIIRSYHRYFKEHGYLTAGQKKTLCDIYLEVIG